jgi:hypothetical protein
MTVIINIEGLVPTVVNTTMKKNVGGYDRLGRLVIGALLVLAGIAGYAGLLGVAVGPIPQALGAVVLILIGAILVVTGYMQTCPINSLLGVNTRGSGDR